MNVFLGAKTQEKRSYIRIPKMFMADLEKNYQLVSNYDFTITYTYPTYATQRSSFYFMYFGRNMD